MCAGDGGPDDVRENMAALHRQIFKGGKPTMKKFLSLVLALVMTMSLVTVSAGAKDFTDDDKITYEEAVAVVSEIGVVDGYADGKFNPTNTLTRQAAAKIICNLILGPTTAAELHADTAPYKDVPATASSPATSPTAPRRASSPVTLTAPSSPATP